MKTEIKISPITKVLANKIAIGTEIKVGGWVRTRRDSKAGLSFIALSDGSCFKPLQVIVPNTLPNFQNEILRLTTGSAIIVTGKLVASPAAGQPVELQAENVEVTGFIDDPDTYPISPKYHTLEYLREFAHLRPRTNVFGAITRLEHYMAMAIHRFFHERGFYWIRTPIITSSDCEGAGQQFRVTSLDLLNLPKDAKGKVDFSQDYFGVETFLTVSGQLNVESYCEAMSKVYTFGPTYRAENSNTSRHLAEFWMVEPEVAFFDLNADADLAAEMLQYLAKAALTECTEDMEFFAARIDKECINRLQGLIDSKFVHLEYTDAIQILQKSQKKFEFPVTWGFDLQSEHERFLAEEYAKAPVIVKNYPKEIKSFYMRLNADGKTVAAMDVLAPGIGEIIGGSQREDRYDVLKARMQEFGLDIELYRWYLDLRRYGSVPHAGFGLGFERFLTYVSGIGNIRDAIPFPRTVKHCKY